MMDYDLEKEEEQEISGKFSLPGIGRGVKLPKFPPFHGKEDEEDTDIPDDPEAEQEESEEKKKPAQKEPVKEEPLAELEPDRITITMLGVSGSGKTMFLSGVYQSLIQDSCSGISLAGDDSRPSADPSVKVTRQIRDIALTEHYSNGEGWVFPLGTNRTVEYPLRLLYQEKEVCGFDFLDYAGGQIANLLDLPESGLNADQEKLLTQLKKSDALLIFADADVIARHRVFASDTEMALCRNEAGADKVNELFNELKSFYSDRSMTVLIVLTKTDKVPDSMRRSNYAELVERTKEVYRNLWTTLRQKSEDTDHPWSIGIVPVTAVGRGNEVRHLKTTEMRDGIPIVIERDVAVRFPQPENMDATMVYAVAAIMKQKCQRLVREEKFLIGQKKNPDPVIRKAAFDRSNQLETLRRKMENYVIDLTQAKGIISKILDRHDVLGWWLN